MQTHFIISRGGLEMGPFTRGELTEKMSKGEFDPIDYVYVEDKSDWVLLLEFLNPTGGTPPPIQKKKTQEAEASFAYPQLNSSKEIIVAPAIALPEVSTKKAEPLHSQPPPASMKQILSTTQSDSTEISSEAPKTAGTYKIRIKAPQGLKVDNALDVKVSPDKAQSLEWSGPNQLVAGAKGKLSLVAKDKFGNKALSFNEKIALKWNSSVPQPTEVQFSLGMAEILFSCQKTQKISVELVHKSLTLPQAHHITIEPGPAARLVLAGPNELTAGSDFKVKVQALDQFGNATHFEGNLELEVEPRSA